MENNHDGFRLAQLTKEQIQHLNALEEEFGFTLVAYENKKDKT